MQDFLNYCGLPDENCYYAVKFGGVCCVALATERMMQDDGFVSQTQLEFLLYHDTGTIPMDM